MPGPRVFELHEANQLLGEVEEVLCEMDTIRARLKEIKIRINALEMIWGPGLKEPDNPDRTELEHHLEEMKAAESEFESCAGRIAELGGSLKGFEPTLVDFYGVHEGLLVFWCWKRGEGEISDWHHIDEGFAGRQSV
ncbi:MAG: hypothetical protein CMJ84_09660 [Planctomycetes bacterium]|jgi:hypothetical protein|nr:hypothetical protein [Planctomycetota bacterium]MDP6410056.1 DUF2203 domain-containing protein [Planctomycetota bacterium]